MSSALKCPPNSGHLVACYVVLCTNITYNVIKMLDNGTGKRIFVTYEVRAIYHGKHKKTKAI